MADQILFKECKMLNQNQYISFTKQFDDAGEKNSCMRIKILGDCYYCVAGVPDEDEDHAHHTVQMGLDMIELIQV